MRIAEKRNAGRSVGAGVWSAEHGVLAEGGFLVRTSFLLLALTAVVKLLGFVRDQIIAFIFGASPVTDAFYIALTFAIGLVSVIGGAFSTAVVPVLTDLWRRRRVAAWRTIRGIGSIYLGLVLGIAMFSVAAAPWLLAHVLGPGLAVSTRPMAVQMIRALSIGFIFWALMSMFAGILNSRKSFVVPACGPIVLNAVLLAVLVAGRQHGALALVVATVVGMVAQFLLLAPFVLAAWARDHREVQHRDQAESFGTDDNGIKRVWTLAGPLLMFGLLSQAPAIIDKAVASGLATGSVSVLSFAQKLTQLPLGLFVGGVATVFYTRLAEAWGMQDSKSAADALGLALGVTFLLAVPAAVGLAILNGPIVQFVFQHGRFDAHSTYLTSQTLLYYCIGLPLGGISLVLVRNAYAAGDAVSPLRSYAIALLVNALGDVILSRFMGPAGIALAGSLGVIALVYLLVLAWEQDFQVAVARVLTASLLRVLAGSGIMAMIILLLMRMTHGPVWLRLGIPGALGLTTYVLFILAWKPREVTLLLSALMPPGRTSSRDD